MSKAVALTCAVFAAASAKIRDDRAVIRHNPVRFQAISEPLLPNEETKPHKMNGEP